MDAYQCPCKRVYLSRKNYIAHLATDHLEEAAAPVVHTAVKSMYRCLQCNVRFIDLKEMFAHIQGTAGHIGEGVKAEVMLKIY